MPANTVTKNKVNPPNIDPADDLLLRVEDLGISFRQRDGELLPVINVANLSLSRNQAVGIVGESGSGKTMLCRALIGTLERHGAVVTSGRIRFEDKDLAALSDRAWRRIRGREIGYVPQSSLAGLNPVLTIETQLIESITAARPIGRQEAKLEAIQLLDQVKIARAEQVMSERPHQLSGGMRQRVMIATAIAQRPKLLIADEPTTALDVTVQHEILSLINTLRQELNMALIFVSHDLAVIEEVCDTMTVMYAGFCVEAGPVNALVQQPRHPYTRALRDSRVDLATPGEDLEAIPGDPVSVGAWPDGCRFWPRCQLATDACQHGTHPPLVPVADQQQSACIHWQRMDESS